MLHIDSSAQQYKEMALSIMKDKFLPFMLGLIVTIASLSAFISQFPTRQVYRVVHDIERNVASATYLHTLLKPPTISQINIEKVLQNANGGGDTKQTSAVKPSPTYFTEQGQISATSTKRVTVKTDTYTVQEGEGLYAIAEKVYGDGMMWTVIAEANGLASPDLIEVGMKLKIPKK